MKNSMMILASALVLVASSNNAQAMDSTQQLAVTGGAAVAGCVAGTVISLASKKNIPSPMEGCVMAGTVTGIVTGVAFVAVDAAEAAEAPSDEQINQGE
jgi:hypothetical protein